METQYINLNMTPIGVTPAFHISQYDVGRMLGFIVHSGGATVDLDTYTCTVEATRSDGTAITSAVATTDNIGTFEVTPTMSNKADKYRCQLVIVDENSKRIASLPFDMDVCKAAMDENSESIEEDASLYQQYTEAVQGAIAEANADIQAEATARQAADSNLQSQINQIVAPSGEAPSAAEIQNARIGADNVTYPTLGAAIRGQVSDLQSVLNESKRELTDKIDTEIFVTNERLLTDPIKYDGENIVGGSSPKGNIKVKNNSVVQIKKLSGDTSVYEFEDIMSNGNFTDMTGWDIANGTGTVDNNELTVQISSVADLLRITHSLQNNAIIGHKYFVTFKFKGLYANGFNVFVGATNYIDSVEPNTWNQCCVITEATGTSGNLNIYLRSTTNYQVGDIVKFKEINVFDITDTFGTGEELNVKALKDIYHGEYVVGTREFSYIPIISRFRILGNDVKADYVNQKTTISEFIVSGKTTYGTSGSMDADSPKKLIPTSKITINGVEYSLPEVMYNVPSGTASNYDIKSNAGVRKVWYKELDGTENWGAMSSQFEDSSRFGLTLYGTKVPLSGVSYDTIQSSHFCGAQTYANDKNCMDLNTNHGLTIRIMNSLLPDVSVSGFKSWLAGQKSAGTPVVIVFELETYIPIASGSISPVYGDKLEAHSNNYSNINISGYNEPLVISAPFTGAMEFKENKYYINGVDVSNDVVGEVKSYDNFSIEIGNTENTEIYLQYVVDTIEYKEKPILYVGNDPSYCDYGPFTYGTRTSGIQEAINFLITGNQTGGTIWIKGILYGTETIILPQVDYTPMMWLDDNNKLIQLRIMGDGSMCSQYILQNADLSKDIMQAKAPTTYSSMDLIIDGVGFAFEEGTIEHRNGLNLYDVLQATISNVCVWGRNNSYGAGIILPYMQKEQTILSRILVSKFKLGFDVTGDWETLDRCETHNCDYGARLLGGFGNTFRDFHTIKIGEGCNSIYNDEGIPARNTKVYGVHSENAHVNGGAIIKGVSASNQLTEREIYAENVRWTLHEVPISSGQVYVVNSGRKGLITNVAIPSANQEKLNNYGDTVQINMTGQNGVHIVDIHGNDIELISNPDNVILNHGESIYFTTPPSSWVWMAM